MDAMTRFVGRRLKHHSSTLEEAHNATFLLAMTRKRSHAFRSAGSDRVRSSWNLTRSVATVRLRYVGRLRQNQRMRLESFHVKNFRNIVDSGNIAVDDDVTCLVGKNESGKSSILTALYRSNPVYPSDKFEVSRDYPRWRLVRDRRDGDVAESVPITCTFELEDDDVAALDGIFGPGVVNKQKFERSVKYSGAVSSTLKVDSAAALKNIYEAAATPKALIKELEAHTEPLQAANAAQQLAVPDGGGFTTAQVAALVAEVQARVGNATVWARVHVVLNQRMPKFFYFSNYQTLPGRIDVRDLGGEEEPGASAMQTARALLGLAQTSADALTEEAFEERKAELEAVSNELTKEVFEYWTQNKELSVEIDLDKITEPVGNGQQAVARFLEVRVKDRRHGFTNNFDQRSSGFQWFFSFLAAFSEFENLEHGVVVLLDEPALTLHGRAQADFLRFIEERLAPAAQVVFTTHSPFMVDVNHLERVRIVEDRGPDQGAVVTPEVMAVGDDSLFPLEAALGYDIAQNLFIGHYNLLVEGTSDFTYLTLISDFLREAGRTCLDERWRLLPAGGATNIPTFVALIGRALDVSVLIDGSLPGVQKLKNLVDRGLLAKKRLLVTDSYTDKVAPSDIEDLFTPGDYLPLYNEAFGTSLKVVDLDGTDRIIARIGRKIGTPFTDHGKPADALLRTRDKVIPKLSETTLARFESLFADINATMVADA